MPVVRSFKGAARHRHQSDIGWPYHRACIERTDLDRLQQNYKEAVDKWVAAIREEEALATSDHSIGAWERWEQAGFKVHNYFEDAVVAKTLYKEGLRLLDYGF